MFYYRNVNAVVQLLIILPKILIMFINCCYIRKTPGKTQSTSKDHSYSLPGAALDCSPQSCPKLSKNINQVQYDLQEEIRLLTDEVKHLKVRCEEKREMTIKNICNDQDKVSLYNICTGIAFKNYFLLQCYEITL